MNKEHKLNLKLIPLAFPIFIERLTGGMVMFADTLFLSQISDEVASSIGMLYAVMLLGYWLLPQFSTAGTSVASQYIGAKKHDLVVPTYIWNILFSTFSAILLAVFTYCFYNKIGLWLGMTDIQNSYAAQYLQVIAFNFIFVGLRFSYASILASKTLTHWNMAATLTTNILNIFLNWALLNGIWIFPKMGIQGIALATVISYIAGLLLLVFFVHVRLQISFFIKGALSKIKEIIIPIMKIGIPSALEPFNYIFQNLIVSAFIIKLGTTAMGANTYIMRLIFIDLTVSWTLTAAGQIIISHRLGAGNIEEVNRTYRQIAFYTITFATLNLLLYLVFYKEFLSIFTADPDIINAGFWILVICLFMEPIRSLNILSGVALKTVGDGTFSVTMGLIFMWGLIPVVWFVTGAGYGIIGIWVCKLIDEILRAGINVWRWNSQRWRKMTIIKPVAEGEF